MQPHGDITLKEFMSVDLGNVRGELAHLRQLIDERDRLYSTQFKSGETAVNVAITAAEKAVNAAFTASEKAIVKAEDAQREYNQRSNEFRGQLDDQAKTLMARTETLTMFKAVEDKINAMQQSFDGKLEAIRISNEKVFDSTTKELASLRESRSEGMGQGVGKATQNVDMRAGVTFAVGVALALVALLEFVLRYAR